MKTVAVVEDNLDNLLIVETILEDLYTVITFVDGSEAIKGLPEKNPDLILLDISLPGINGIEVLQFIRKDEALREKPVIALTAHAMSGDREKYLAHGFNEYISKPIVDPDSMINMISRLLE